MQTWANTIGGVEVHAEAVALVDVNGVAITSIPATIGQKTKATALGVTLASDEDILAALGWSATPPSRFANLGSSFTSVVKNAPGRVISLTCLNLNTSKKAWAQLFDRTTLPTGGTVPLYAFYVPPLSQIVIGDDFFTKQGASFADGIAFGFSGTNATYTAATLAAEGNTFIHYT